MNKFLHKFDTVSLCSALDEPIKAITFIQQGRVKVRLPVFNDLVEAWYGSSFITREFRLELPRFFSFQLSIPKPIEADFCLAVRYGQSGNPIRFKLWKDVGELLTYPLYRGQILPGDSVLEVWTTKDKLTTSLSEALILTTSLLLDRENCCEDSSVTNEYVHEVPGPVLTFADITVPEFFTLSTESHPTFTSCSEGFLGSVVASPLVSGSNPYFWVDPTQLPAEEWACAARLAEESFKFHTANITVLDRSQPYWQFRPLQYNNWYAGFEKCGFGNDQQVAQTPPGGVWVAAIEYCYI